MAALAVLAFLFVIYVAFLIGRRVAQEVPDEIGPARKYVRMAPDVLTLMMAGLLLAQERSVPLAVAAVVALAALRATLPSAAACALASGLALALAFFSAPSLLVPLGVLCLALNYLVGALSGDMKDAARVGALQPAAAGMLLLALRLVL